MKKTIIIVVLSIINIGFTNAQVELKGKKLQERLEFINNVLNSRDYEYAIKLFISQDTIISEKNVKKKELPLYMQNDSIIKSKIAIFDENKRKVLALKNAYDSNEYDMALQMLDLQLNNENSYLESQNIQNQLKVDLTIIKKQYVNFNAINLFVDKLNFSKLEPTQFDLFINNLKSLVNTSDNAVSSIITKYPAMKVISEREKEKTGNKCITKVNQFVNNPIVNELDYVKVSTLIMRVKTLHSFSDKLFGAFGHYSVSGKQSDTFNQILNDKVISLQKYKAANRPTIIEAIEFIDTTNVDFVLAVDTVAVDTTTVSGFVEDKVKEPIVEKRIEIDKTLLRKGLAGDIAVFYYRLKNPNGLFVNHKGLDCFLEDNDSIPFNGIVKVYDEYGDQLVAEHNFVNGKKEGKYTIYYNGKLTSRSEVNYINGKKEGKYTTYDENGKLRSEVNYVNDKKEGQEYDYYQDKKYPTCYYINDKLEGKGISYTDGEVDWICNYVNDKLEGKRIEYYKGRLWATYNYVNGKKEGKYERYFVNGKIAEVCYYKNDKKDGKELIYWVDSGNPLKGETNWVNGVKEGYSIENKGAVKETSCYYLHGKMHGEYMFHDDDGDKRIVTMVNGEMIGPESGYYRNGNIWFKVMRKIINGESQWVGKITYYDKYENGKIDHYENAK